ncbi:hypothetical protein [Nostoc sp. MG11]|uniref:hypothetical protein n=1 Tax=Nostoc sp. MG11 TaxID=2721166 RepID=UPI00186955B5|nr:hypothetical protein [Nostoc sp. MG11]
MQTAITIRFHLNFRIFGIGFLVIMPNAKSDRLLLLDPSQLTTIKNQFSGFLVFWFYLSGFFD